MPPPAPRNSDRSGAERRTRPAPDSFAMAGGTAMRIAVISAFFYLRAHFKTFQVLFHHPSRNAQRHDDAEPYFPYARRRSESGLEYKCVAHKVIWMYITTP